MKTTAILCLSISLPMALASPARGQDLSIPIENVVSQNLSAFADHALLPKYQAWYEQNKNDFSFLNGAAEYPTALKAIVCRPDNASCLLQSIIQLTPEEISMLSSAASSSSRLLARANANQWYAATHWKTYYQGDEGGDEHYTTWNLRCGTLVYSSTSFYTGPEGINVKGDNNIYTKVRVTSGRNYHHVLELQQNFICKTFGNQCCVNNHNVANMGSATLNRYTWDCQKGQSASPCQG